MRYSSVLVTGATGFVGRYMVSELLDRGYSVVCFVKNGVGENALDRLEVEVRRGDIRDRTSVFNAMTDVGSVIHLAAAVGIPDPEVNYAVNVEGSRNVVEACEANGVARLIAFSSISAKREQASAYGLSKRKSEQIILDSGLQATVLRTEMIYGNGSRGLNKIIRQIQMFPFVIPMAGRGRILRQPVYVRDVVRLTIDILDNPASFKKLFEVAGKDRVMLRDFVTLVARELGIRKRILPVPKHMALGIAYIVEKLFKPPPFTYDNMLGLTVSTNLDITVAENQLGFTPMSLQEGIRLALHEMGENPVLSK